MTHAVLQSGPVPDFDRVLADPLARLIYGRSCLYYAKFGQPMPEHEIKKIEAAFRESEPGEVFVGLPFDAPAPAQAPLFRYWGVWDKVGNYWYSCDYFPLKSIAEAWIAELVADGVEPAFLEAREWPADQAGERT